MSTPLLDEITVFLDEYEENDVVDPALMLAVHLLQRARTVIEELSHGYRRINDDG